MNKLLTSVLGLLSVTATGLPLQAEEQAPRLIIGIHINQLDANYLEWFRNGFGEDGFRKIMQSGTQFTNMVYASARPDNAAACASFMTGGTPREHGITGARWYDPESGKRISCIFDSRFLGNYTQETVSPKNLLGSTLGDELKKASNNEAYVYAVGIDADETIMLGGHSANGVFWLDDKTGKWCTSTYFSYMPWWLQTINDREDMGQLVGETTWSPLKALSNYKYMPHQKGPTLFQYLFNKPGNKQFRSFKESPLMNAAVIRIASEILEKEDLGKDDVTDYLVIQLSADGKLDNRMLSAMEIQDVYFRLDEDISKLLKITEKKVGNDNIRIYLTGTGQPVLSPVDVPKEKAYIGDFYPDRCTSLLNLYLMAIYGNEPWVSAWERQEIFLNHRKIEEKGINFNELSRKAASFLAEFSGVTRVYERSQLLLGNTDADLRAKANAIRPDRAADLYVEIQGGWNVREASQEEDYQVSNTFFSSPFILYKPDQKAQTINTPVGVGDITASLSRIFRIRPPNACQGVVLPELK
jgi:hypothetical protein